MNRKIKYSVIFVTGFFSLNPVTSWSKELLGNIEFTEFLLEPYFKMNETKKGAFAVGRYAVGLTWKGLSDWQAKVSLGSCELAAPSRWYPQKECGAIGLTGAFVEWRSSVGTVAAGLIPLAYGLEGGTEELNLSFPRSLFYQGGYLHLRDVGLRYEVANHQYFTNITLVNGEAGEDRDSNLWVVSQWGWGVNKPFRVGFGGQTGYTDVSATNPEKNSPTISGFDINTHSKIRLGQFFMRQNEKTWSLAMEINIGEILQDSNQTQFIGGHLDGIFNVGEAWGIMARYDQIDRSRDPGDATFETSVGLFFNGLFKMSNLHIILKRSSDEGQNTAIHEGLIAWKISPTYN